ncbi:MAG: hypothetical protein N2C13_04435 [Chloroflexota bacterium]
MKINQKAISKNTLQKIEAELELAHKAREKGNAGKERVAARRAIGLAIQSFYQHKGVEFTSQASFDSVRFMCDDDDISKEIKILLQHFTQRLKKDSPDEESYWPLNVVLIGEVRQVIDLLNNPE